MLILSHLLSGIAAILDMVLTMMVILVVARAVLSWVNPDPYNPIVRFLSSSTDPLLRPLQRKIPLVGGGIDITPIVLLLGLAFLQYSLVPLLHSQAYIMSEKAKYEAIPRGYDRSDVVVTE